MSSRRARIKAIANLPVRRKNDAEKSLSQSSQSTASSVSNGVELSQSDFSSQDTPSVISNNVVKTHLIEEEQQSSSSLKRLISEDSFLNVITTNEILAEEDQQLSTVLTQPLASSHNGGQCFKFEPTTVKVLNHERLNIVTPAPEFHEKESCKKENEFARATINENITSVTTKENANLSNATAVKNIGTVNYKITCSKILQTNETIKLTPSKIYDTVSQTNTKTVLVVPSKNSTAIEGLANKDMKSPKNNFMQKLSKSHNISDIMPLNNNSLPEKENHNIAPDTSATDNTSIFNLPHSPSKNRARIRPTPRLGHRRNSTQGIFTGESEDEGRNQNRVKGILHTPPVTKLYKPSQYGSHNSDCDERPAKRFRRSEHSRKVAEARKSFIYKFGSSTPDRSQLTVFDMIYYNPPANPMKRTIEDGSITNTEEIDKTEESEELADDPKMQKGDPPSTAVPQIKIGTNGQIIIDELSLVVETTGSKKGREEIASSNVVYDSCTTSYGIYKRRRRPKEWSMIETLRFYKSLNTVGTDFSIMLALFPGRSRNDLKLKFKKEEKVNSSLVNKALSNPQDFDMLSLEEQLQRDEEISKEKKEEKKQMRKSAKIKSKKEAKTDQITRNPKASTLTKIVSKVTSNAKTGVEKCDNIELLECGKTKNLNVENEIMELEKIQMSVSDRTSILPGPESDTVGQHVTVVSELDKTEGLEHDKIETLEPEEVGVLQADKNVVLQSDGNGIIHSHEAAVPCLSLETAISENVDIETMEPDETDIVELHETETMELDETETLQFDKVLKHSGSEVDQLLPNNSVEGYESTSSMEDLNYVINDIRKNSNINYCISDNSSKTFPINRDITDKNILYNQENIEKHISQTPGKENVHESKQSSNFHNLSDIDDYIKNTQQSFNLRNEENQNDNILSIVKENIPSSSEATLPDLSVLDELNLSCGEGAHNLLNISQLDAEVHEKYISSKNDIVLPISETFRSITKELGEPNKLNKLILEPMSSKDEDVKGLKPYLQLNGLNPLNLVVGDTAQYEQSSSNDAVAPVSTTESLLPVYGCQYTSTPVSKKYVVNSKSKMLHSPSGNLLLNASARLIDPYSNDIIFSPFSATDGNIDRDLLNYNEIKFVDISDTLSLNNSLQLVSSPVNNIVVLPIPKESPNILTQEQMCKIGPLDGNISSFFNTNNMESVEPVNSNKKIEIVNDAIKENHVVDTDTLYNEHPALLDDSVVPGSILIHTIPSAEDPAVTVYKILMKSIENGKPIMKKVDLAPDEFEIVLKNMLPLHDSRDITIEENSDRLMIDTP